MEEHAAAWTKPSRPSNGSNLVVIPRTYTGGRSPRSWVQLHAEQPHPALRQLASPTRGQRMLCESQPPVSSAGAKAHSLSARALLLDALGTVARYATAPIASSLSLCGCSAKALHPSPSLLLLFCSHSSPAVRRDAETPAQPRLMDPSAHPPTNPHRPSISSPPPPDIVSLLTPRRFPSRLRIRCSSPAPHLAPPCYPMYIYTSLDAKCVLFCVAYALVCAGRAVLYVHARRP